MRGPTLRLGLFCLGWGCVDATRDTLCVAFTCVPSQPGLWGWEGKSRWKLGEELLVSSR